MTRISPLEADHAQGKAKAILEGVRKSTGKTPNLLATLAHSPAALDAYTSISKALNGGRLSPQFRELVALTVSGENGCEYCAAAHWAIGQSLGAGDEDLDAALRGFSADPHTAAGLEFARRIVIERGWVSDQDLQRVRDAGYSDGDIAEITATVAGTIFSNYFNHIAQTEVDFPPVKMPVAA